MDTLRARGLRKRVATTVADAVESERKRAKTHSGLTLGPRPRDPVDDLAHLTRGLEEAREELGPVLRAQLPLAALEHPGEALHDGQRRPQVVRELVQLLLGQGPNAQGPRAASAHALHRRPAPRDAASPSFLSIVMSPRCSAIAMACTRFRACSLRMTLRTCVRTVSTDTPSCAPRPVPSRPPP